MKQLPDFDQMVALYPGKGRTAASVKQEIGGSVNSPDIDDTCIVRLSKPLNYLGHPIPATGFKLIKSAAKDFRTRKGTDKLWYGLRVREFWPYLEQVYGPPTVRAKPPLDVKKFQTIRGIIGFRVEKWASKGATGHFTLWDGYNLLYGGEDHNYWAIADEAALWEAGGGIRAYQPEV